MEREGKKMINVCCPGCTRLLFSGEEFSNINVRCPKCGARIKAEGQLFCIQISFEFKEAV